MQMNAKKVLVTLLAAVLLVGCTIGGTLAWLSASTDEVENTFTVGEIKITLTETFNTKSSDSLSSNDKWVGKIVPGGKEAKDPTITVQAGSEKCYVYALVENNMKIDNDIVVVPNIDTAKWIVVATNGNKTLYRYATIVDASSDDVPCEVFTEVSYDGEKITETNIATLAQYTITVDAFAHQSDNISDISVADAAATAHFGISSST